VKWILLDEHLCEFGCIVRKKCCIERCSAVRIEDVNNNLAYIVNIYFFPHSVKYHVLIVFTPSHFSFVV